MRLWSVLFIYHTLSLALCTSLRPTLPEGFTLSPSVPVLARLILEDEREGTSVVLSSVIGAYGT